ncbi:MAG: type II secretion system F family protein [Steroidobacteraceae bacterium]
MRFRVKAMSSAQDVLSYVLDAVDELDARRQVAGAGLAFISIARDRRVNFGNRSSRVPLVTFSQELVALLDAGLSLVESIETLAEKEASPAARRTLEQVLVRLREGQTFGAALTEHPQSFPALYVATVRAAERTGALREALTRFVTYQQQVDLLRKSLVNASIYPAVLCAAGLLVVAFLMGYVVPRFSSIYEDLGSNLPLASRLLMRWGQFLDAHGFMVVVATLATIASLAYAGTRAGVRAAIGARLASIPALGSRLHIYQLARLYRTVGMLQRGGTPMVTALRMSAGLLSANLRPAFADATQAVREGRSVGDAMEQFGLTTPVAARMLRVGERSGNMGEMMERIAAFYDDELSRWVALMTRLIEPALMSLIGIMIGVIVVLMYFPIFELAGSIR